MCQIVYSVNDAHEWGGFRSDFDKFLLSGHSIFVFILTSNLTARFMDLVSLVKKARTSSFYLWLLNFSFNRFVPFNRPHGFRILEVGDFHVKTMLPFRRSNLNHLKGLHACALATLTEITGGFLLAVKLDPTRYRLILKKLEVDYLYQGKTDAFGMLTVTQEWLNERIIAPLAISESVDVVTEVIIKDTAGNSLTSGKAHWQVKDWSKVKTKVQESK